MRSVDLSKELFEGNLLCFSSAFSNQPIEVSDLRWQFQSALAGRTFYRNY